MKVRKQYFEWGDGRKLKDIQAIVIYWDVSRGIPTADGLWDWMNFRGLQHRKNGDTAPYYHGLISRNTVIETMSTEYRAIHCGHRTYRKKAKEFFGEKVCSPYDSPNNHTLGYCMLHDFADTGGYHADTMETAIEYIAWKCKEFDLDPNTDLLRHSDITNEKSVPCPKAFFEDDDDPDDLWDSFKHWVARELHELNNNDSILTMKEELLANPC